MILLGCRLPGRHTEQHDIFFGIGEELKDLIPDIKKSWPGAKGNMHVDAWREVTTVDGYTILVEDKAKPVINGQKEASCLFFINLGGYRENEFEEFHYKMLVVADSMEEAKSKAKKTAFFKHTSLNSTPNTPTATSHIDDKYGIDIDDLYAIEDILPDYFKKKYTIRIQQKSNTENNKYHNDEYHLGYFKLTEL